MHRSQREYDFVQSIKKHIIDNLPENLKTSISFGLVMGTPVDVDGNKLSQWIIVEFSGRSKKSGFVGTEPVTFDLYTRKDSEHSNLYKLSDIIRSLFEDEYGVIPVDFYDVSETPWVKSSQGIVPAFHGSSEIFPAPNKISMRAITYNFIWGTTT